MSERDIVSKDTYIAKLAKLLVDERTNLDFNITGLTGGTAANLDGVATTDKSAGWIISVVIADEYMTYVLRSGTQAESAPKYIRPDDYDAGTNAKYWELVGRQEIDENGNLNLPLGVVYEAAISIIFTPFTSGNPQFQTTLQSGWYRATVYGFFEEDDNGNGIRFGFMGENVQPANAGNQVVVNRDFGTDPNVKAVSWWGNPNNASLIPDPFTTNQSDYYKAEVIFKVTADNSRFGLFVTGSLAPYYAYGDFIVERIG